MKTAIIGGGVCGLYLAGKLAEKGENITLFESKKEIGKQSCSGLFSQRIFDYIPESEKLIQNKINNAIIHFPKKTLKVAFSKKFVVMNHSELDKLTAIIAENNGAEIILNHKIEHLPIGFDRVIGCDGALSFTRKALNLRAPKFRLAIQGFIKKPDDSDFVETWPVEQGFIWKIPRGKEIEYGILANPKNARFIFNRFSDRHNLKLSKISSSVVSQSQKPPEPRKHITTICGEAMIGTKPWSGGGVVWGLKNCDLLLRHFPDFFAYEKENKKIFAREIFFSKLLTKLVYFFGFNFPYIIPREIKIDGDYLLK